MKNEVAVFMLNQINERIRKRKRPIDPVLAFKIDQVQNRAILGRDLNSEDSIFLTKQYERFSDPDRLKWGSHVRIT